MEPLFTGVNAWQSFLLIGVVLCVAEIFVPGFVALPVGVGFLAAGIAAYFTDSLPLQLGVLAILQVMTLVFAKSFFKDGRLVRSNADGMAGQQCEVIEDIRPNKPGYVKLYGDRWQAVATLPISAGTQVLIIGLDGNKVRVKPANE
jgi:membrane protein implicated in regulation of membrane protease activity